ncbi:hypothetical protein EWM64_g6892 [Hericium alpestre]|uniref:BTB domain-containing protein n=1 Tax=Hericium alpestre TaxID=135208 RepID=A0A4Y9ZQD7_9AGAM|nr:hypothetical protein EWM64_g6892 [Hericium alpestre]
MFSLPQSAASTETVNQTPLRDMPIIPVEEDRHALYLLLRTCYPVRAPKLSASMSDLRLALRMARKYDVDVLLGLAEEALVSMLHFHPVSVYALASCYQLDDLVTRSAIATRKLHLRDLHSEDLYLIDGKQCNALVQYHRRCGDAACQITVDWSWLTTFPSAIFLTGGEWALLSSCGCHPADNTYRISTSGGMNYKGTHWWRRYIDMSKAALEMRPCGEAVLDEALLSTILADARACRTCKVKIDASPDCLKNFAVAFAAEIERVMEQVPFVL